MKPVFVIFIYNSPKASLGPILAKFAYAPKVLNALEEEGCVGAKLPLMCPRHVELDLEVGQQCHHVCNALLPCGHSCRQPCHREGHHPDCDQEVLVTLPCGHERSCKCSEKEGASERLKCSKLVDFRHDVCQHPDTRKCWDKKKRCETPVMMCCDRCREESQVPFYIKKDSPENFKCSKPCTRKMSCTLAPGNSRHTVSPKMNQNDPKLPFELVVN